MNYKPSKLKIIISLIVAVIVIFLLLSNITCPACLGCPCPTLGHYLMIIMFEFFAVTITYLFLSLIEKKK